MPEQDEPARPPVPTDGFWFWATDTRRWAPCDQDDPRGHDGEGLEHPKTLA
ncbi:hypothetical protein [Kitasatospora sp. P5_F3]